MRHVAAAVLSVALLSGAAYAATGHVLKPSTSQLAAVADKSRPEKDVARDAERKPAEMLAFAGVKPGMKVADFWPGGGYFTRVLSRAVGPKGRVYAVAPSEIKQFGQKALDQLDGLNKDPKTPNVKASFQPAAEFSTPEQVDVVWTSQNYHDLHDKFAGPVDVAKFNKAVYASLKPGGVFIVLDHVAQPGSGLRDTDTLHRIDPGQVIQEVTAAGFVFEGGDEALFNPLDDHRLNVFDKGIRGHTDQFVYKFRKPRR